MHFEDALAIKCPLSSLISPPTYPVALPRRTTLPSACKRASHTGRKKLIFNSTVVKDSSAASVLANAIPIAASAMSQRIPPCSVPIGLACCGPAANMTVARPFAISFASNPIRRATATSFVLARVLKSGFNGVSGVLMTFPSESSFFSRERWSRDNPRDDDRLDPAGLPFAADDSPPSFLRAYLQSMYTVPGNQHCHGLLHVPPLLPHRFFYSH